jgi:hypothetical protein
MRPSRGEARLWRLALVFGATALISCGNLLPEPKMADDDHLGEEPQVVLSMPPPGKVEIVPRRPPELRNPVWIDGEWEWTGRRWVWKEHGWQEAPPGEVYEPPVTKRLPDGKLVHFPGAWKKEKASHEAGDQARSP